MKDAERTKKQYKGGNADTAGQVHQKRRYEIRGIRTRVGNTRET